MGFLSLQDPPPASAPRLTRAEGIGVSIAAHLVLLVLFLLLPGRIPEVFMQFLRPSPVAHDETLRADAEREAASVAAETPPIPLKFAYVRIPDDTPVEIDPTERTHPLRRLTLAFSRALAVEKG